MVLKIEFSFLQRSFKTCCMIFSRRSIELGTLGSSETLEFLEFLSFNFGIQCVIENSERKSYSNFLRTLIFKIIVDLVMKKYFHLNFHSFCQQRYPCFSISCLTQNHL